MNNLKNLVKDNLKTVYVYLANADIAYRFLQDAEEEGFIFSDGTKPTEKEIDDFFAVHPNLTINYIGYIGRMAYQSHSDNIIRLDYEKFINGESEN
ncbi:hypothetical protein [Porcipelethomonas sp.]|uniref:hypothetical protein n=1 Tax=Porcipelethomonas sp. TaxID=2981675 RepID=UPI003EF4F40F